MNKNWFSCLPGCIAFCLFWGLNACKDSPQVNTGNAELTGLNPHYDTLLITREWGNCSGSDQGCVTLSVSIPNFNDSSSTAKEMNSLIQHLVLGNYRDSFETIESYMDYVISDYQLSVESDPLLTGWQLEHEVYVEYLDSHTISLRHDYFDNRGGAHPDLGLNLRSYDLKSMKRLVLNQLFEGDFDVALTEIGRKYLRLSLETNLSLSNDPKEIESLVSRFVPSDLFLLNAEGIQFYLPVEDMNQVVMDWVIFTIPYEVLVSGLPINPQGPISYLHQKNSRANS